MSPLPAILGDPAARARWITWRVALFTRRAGLFRSSRGRA